MAITPILPVFPVPVLPQSFDTSLSYYELLAKLTETINQCVTTVNALSESVSEIEQAIGDLPQLSDDVAQLKLDLAAETQARSDGYDTLYNQINQVRTLVINEYVDNQTFDATLAGGIKIRLITKVDYDALDPKDASTLYIITNNGTATLAFADSPISQMAAGTAYRSLRGAVNTPITGTVTS